MQNPDTQSPVNPIPPVIVALFLVIMGIELVFSMGARGLAGGPGAVGWRLGALNRYAFSGEIFDWMVQTKRFPAEHLIRFVSYVFVHATFTQALFAGAMLLALGKFVGERIGGLRTLIIFLTSAVGAALIFALATNSPAPLIGAFPSVYGLIGAFTYMLWLRLGEVGAQQIRAFTMIGFLMALQLVFGLLFGGDITWVADIAGFACGFAMCVLLVPGGWQRIRERIRRN